MDPFEKALRLAMFNIAEKLVRDMFSPDTVDWAMVSKLVRHLAEVEMAMPEAEKIPQDQRHRIIEETTAFTLKNIHEHIISGLIPGVMMLVWRSFSYSTLQQWQERLPTLKMRLDRNTVEKTEELINSMWRDYWKHFQPGLLCDSRGQKVKWSASALMQAINQAAPKVPAARWSFDAVAGEITKNEQPERPLTGDALRKLINRNHLKDFWKQWRKSKTGHKK